LHTLDVISLFLLLLFLALKMTHHVIDPFMTLWWRSCVHQIWMFNSHN